MTRVEEWVRETVDDARRRGLDELVPLLEGLGRATAALRAAGWNERAVSRLGAEASAGRGREDREAR